MNEGIGSNSSGVRIPDILSGEKIYLPHEQDAKEEVETTGDDSTSDIKEEYQTGLQLVLLMISILFTVCLTSLDMTIVGTAIPKITDEFHGLGMVSWVGLHSPIPPPPQHPSLIGSRHR